MKNTIEDLQKLIAMIHVFKNYKLIKSSSKEVRGNLQI